jgi:hypothetical protein
LSCGWRRRTFAWGYRWIVCEFKKFGIRTGTPTVKKILKGYGVHPAPGNAFKKPAVPWTTFVRAHMESMAACDFMTKRIYALRGVFTAYTLVFIHLGSRRVYCSPADVSGSNAETLSSRPSTNRASSNLLRNFGVQSIGGSLAGVKAQRPSPLHRRSIPSGNVPKAFASCVAHQT